MTDYDYERRIGFDTKLSAEAAALLTDAAFVRSPVLSKLLRYLVDETIKGHGDTLKSYSVAVDGLGRPDSFDAASDSSARVQMVRLRKALESYYAQHGPSDDQCLYLQPGSYRVRLGKLAHAYPRLYRPLSDIENGSIKLDAVSQSKLSESTVPENFGIGPRLTIASSAVAKSRIFMMAIGSLTGVAIAIVAWLGWQQFAQARTAQISPMVELLPVEHTDTAGLENTAHIISSSFANDLPRFKIARIATSTELANNTNAKVSTANYQLFSQVEPQNADSQKLYLRLFDINSSTTIWTRQIEIPNQTEKIADAIAPIMAELNGPFGAVVTHSTMLYTNSEAGGYPCLTKYFAFLKLRSENMESHVAACLKKPVEEARLRSTILATRSFFALETRNGIKNFDAALLEARKLANQAVMADPNDSVALFAMARLAYFGADCVSARYYTRKAVEANPNSPVILGNLASLANQCAYKDAGKLLDRAFLLQSGGNWNYRLLLALGAVSQNRTDKFAELAEMSVPRSGKNRVNYYLTETLIAAAQNRTADAVLNWKLFSTALPSSLKTPEQRLQNIILSPTTRARLIRYLTSKNVFVVLPKK